MNQFVKERSEFKLVGLSQSLSFTCEYDQEETFWAKCGLSADRFNALFAWAKSDKTFWQSVWIVVVEHDGFYEDGCPKNPVVVEVKEQD